MKGLTRVVLAAAAVLVTATPARAAALQGGQVTGVSLLPAPGRAEVVVGVRGDVEVKDFVLRSPDRLVLDVSGARLAGISTSYDGVVRGGVKNIRYGQYQSDIVRVVIELDALKDYKVERTGDAVSVAFASDLTFLSWSSNTPGAMLLSFLTR